MKLRHAGQIVALMTALGTLALLGLVFFLLLPALKRDRALSAEIRQAHAELDAQYANRKNLLSSKEKSDTARETMKKLATQFVPSGKELDLITGIEALAAKDGVTERISLSLNDGGKSADELKESYDITIEGPYRAVLQMMIDLEKSPTLLVPNAVQVRPNPSTDPKVDSFLSVNIRGAFPAPPKGL